MRFQIIRDVRLPVPDDGSCKEHAARFASDHAGSYHVIADCEIIFRSKIALDHLTHLLVSGHHYVAHPATLFGDVCFTLVKDLRAVEESVPRIGELLFRRSLCKT